MEIHDRPLKNDIRTQTNKSTASESTYCKRTWAPTLLMREKQAAASDVKTKTDGTQLTVAGQHVQQSATHSHLQMSIYRVTQKNGNI